MTEQYSRASLLKHKTASAAKLSKKASHTKKSKQFLRGESEEIIQRTLSESIQEEEAHMHKERPKINYKEELMFLFFDNMLETIIQERGTARPSIEESESDLFPFEQNSCVILVEDVPDYVPDIQEFRESIRPEISERSVIESEEIGQFKNGYPSGKGKMIMPDLNRYDGEVCQGYYHGFGVLNLSNSLTFYKGSWKSGKRHGKGWIEYEMNANYVGDWLKDNMHGVGYRKYKNGARYKGQWQENAKHGKGSMIFENNDYYTGEWQYDKPHGYGEYTWNMFLNKTLTFPIYNIYRGSWFMGTRHGVGLLYFGTECGSKLAGTWKNNRKHGPGVIACGNGRIMEYCPLFTKDKPAHKDREQIRKLQEELSKKINLPKTYDNSFAEIVAAIHSKIAMTSFPKEILQNIVMAMVAPLKRRFSSPRFIKLTDSQTEGKKIYCPLNISIHCISENVEMAYFINEIFRHLHSFRDSFSWSQCNIADSDISVGCIRVQHRRGTDDYPVEKFRETKMLQNMITVYLPQLRALYEKYASITVNEGQTLNFKPVMVRLFLWQLLRDVNIQKFVSLVDYDNFMYANPCSCYEYGPHYPFEHIFFWQFLQCLVVAAWQYYLNRCHPAGISMGDMLPPGSAVDELGTGFVSQIFKRFLEYVISPNSDSIKGVALTRYKDVLPLDGAYNLYLSLGEPHTVNMFLNSSCPNEGVQIPCYIGIQPECDPIKDGFNATLLGEKPSYVGVRCTPLEKIIEKEDTNDLWFNLDRCQSPKRTKETDEFYRSLYTFRDLGRTTIVKCVHKVCPMVEKPKTFKYKLTFLEFYEILFECSHCKVEQIRENNMEYLKMKLIEDILSKRPSECTSTKSSKGLKSSKRSKATSRKSFQI
ncbi:unnamed protein product [Acanthoscelides obtectus]|uniref:Uncharacterized protein n=2 Tax=Acanthoscelides obtectus TaxID=200917 RepID=A0A9P0M7Y7_ACAOB|nr:unnamed protein product [Acanthoscelides obtectus]CAK1642137.1 Radial spoke head 10 homolog B2 [Acanthoscelides obtectus]